MENRDEIWDRNLSTNANLSKSAASDFYLYGVIAINLNRFKSQRALLLETNN